MGMMMLDAMMYQVVPYPVPVTVTDSRAGRKPS
jgi:hypothetical protein